MSDPARRTVELATRVQQIPAPTFSEAQRAEFVRTRFLEEGLSTVFMDKAGNVYACVPGGAGVLAIGQPPLVVCAHLDTVFQPGADLAIRREPGRIFGPGIGDNSMGVAALFGVLWSLQGKRRAGRDLWLVADVQEEGLGNLRGMRAVVDHFGEDVLGYVVIEGLAFGHIYNRAVGVRRLQLKVRTQGGHAWSDYGLPSAVHELAGLVAALAKIRLPTEPRSTLNVGTIHGGSGVNVLAAEAVCELDLRSESSDTLARLEAEVRRLTSASIRAGVEIEISSIGERPAGYLAPEHRFVRLACESLLGVGADPDLTSGSTDANIPLSRGIPAIVLGVTTGGGAHTVQEYVDVEPVVDGLAQLTDCIGRLLE